MMHASLSSPLSLPLWGKARLLSGERTVPVRRKALAILYYLALEGETPRERLADLLWGHSLAANNLRVELSHLRQFLERRGLQGIPGSRDPVELPDGVTLAAPPKAARPATELLLGLDDLSPEYQHWLERKRMELQHEKPQLFSALIEELAAAIQPPFLVLIQPQFGASARSTAQQLAAKLHLSYHEGIEMHERADRKPALRFVPPPYSDDTAAAVLAAANTVFVVEQSGISETPPALLRLRAQHPAERTRYVKLPPLSWAEAQSYLQDLPFTEAAGAYLASTGNPVYLQELSAMRLQLPAFTAQQLPRRISAIVNLKTSRLSAAALLTLERCSVHPGVLPDRLLQVLQVDESAEELERFNWLQFHPELQGWTISSQLARRVIYETLQTGRRRNYHELAANCFAEQNQQLPALYHQHQATGTKPPRPKGLPSLPGWSYPSLDAWLGNPSTAPAPPKRALLAGEELLLLPVADYTDADQAPGSIVVERWLDTPEQLFRWDLPEEPFLLRLRGRGLADIALGIGLSGTAAPLELSWTTHRRRVILAHARRKLVAADRELLLPLTAEFEYWLCLPAGGQMLISSRAETALIEFEVAAFSYAEAATGYQSTGPAATAVSAIILTENTLDHQPDQQLASL